jgi:hypothetical protein
MALHSEFAIKILFIHGDILIHQKYIRRSWDSAAAIAGVKRPGREADHSPSTSAEVKKMWIYTSTSPYTFMA